MLVIFEQLFSPPTQAQTTLLYDTNYTTLWDRTALYTTLQFASACSTIYSRSIVAETGTIYTSSLALSSTVLSVLSTDST
jgi:hypothetical protein